METIDRETSEISHGENPYVYLWEHNPEAIPASDREQLIQLLTSRRYLIGSAGPELKYSAPLSGYVCQHLWFAIMESLPTATYRAALIRMVQQDPKFKLVEAAGQSGDSSTAIIVGVFSTKHDAEELAIIASSADTIAEKRSAVRHWGDFFGSSPLNCPTTQ